MKRRAPDSVECLLFDLDDTLYDVPAVAQQVAANIQSYMVERLGIPKELAEEQYLSYYLDYGTTLAGLVANGHTIDYDDWHAYVHGSLDYEKYLKPDPLLRQLLFSLPQPKYVLTNADQPHAERCLALLGVADCFCGVLSFESLQEAAALEGLAHHGRPVVCKPSRRAFELALQLAGGPDPAAAVFFDDSIRNVQQAARAGICSVLVGRTGMECSGAAAQVRRLADLPCALPWLWEVEACDGAGLRAQEAREAVEEQEGVEASDGALGAAVVVQA